MNSKNGEGQRAGAKKGSAAAGTTSLSTPNRKQSQLAGVPLLHWRSDGHGNMDQFIRAFGPYAAQHFGLAGLFLDAGTEEYPPLLAPDIPAQDVGISSVEAEFIAKAYQSRFNAYLKRLQDFEDDKRRLYYQLWQQLTPAAEDRVRQEASFASVKASMDPIQLWRLLKKAQSHVEGGIAIFQQEAAHDAFTALRMGPAERLSDFKDRFDSALRMLSQLGHPDIPDDGHQGAQFIRRLDPGRYGTLMQSIYNRILPVPNSAAAAYTLATEFVNIRRTGATANASECSVFTTSFDDIPRDSKSHANAKSKKPASNKRSDSKPDTNRGKQQGNRSNKGDSKPRRADITCSLCGKMDLPLSEKQHLTHLCPHIDKFARQLEGKKSVLSTRTETTDDDDFKYTGTFTTVTKPYNSTDTTATMSSVYSRICLALQRHPDVITDNCIILDNASGESLVKNKHLLVDLKRAKQGLCYSGITGGPGSRTRTVGYLPCLGADVYYAPDAVVSVVSFSQLRQLGRVSYDEEHDYFTAKPTNGDEMVFESAYFPGHGTLYYHEIVPDRQTVQLATTVTDNESRYTQREIQGARKARQLSMQLAYPSADALCRALSNGTIHNTTVTPSDVRRADAIYGKDVAALRGKTTSSKPATVSYDSIDARGAGPARSKVTLHADLMYIDNDPYLVTVGAPLQVNMLTHLRGKRDLSTLQHAMSTHLAAYNSYHVTVSGVVIDNESGARALKPWLEAQRPGIACELVGAGDHVPLAEIAIRRIKERARAHICNPLIRYRIPKRLRRYLMVLCAQRINLMPSRSAPGGMSPWECLTGRKVDCSKDVRVSFLEYVQAHVPLNDSDKGKRDVNTPRTEGALALLPTMNQTGAVKFLSLKTRREIVRSHWTPLPMPDDVIDAINRMADEDGGGDDADMVFCFGQPGRIVDGNAVDEEADNVPIILDDVMPPQQGLAPLVIVPDAAMPPADTAPTFIAEDDHSLIVDQPAAADQQSAAQQPIITGVSADVSTAISTAADPQIGRPLSSNTHVRFGDDDDYLPDVRPSSTNWSAPTSDLRTGREHVSFSPRALSPVEDKAPAPQHRRSTRIANQQSSSLAYAHPDAIAARRSSAHAVVSNYVYHSISTTAFHVTCASAFRQYGPEAKQVAMAELSQLHEMGTWTPIRISDLTPAQRRSIVRSSLFFKEKFKPGGEFDRLKARLVAGGDQQDRSLYSESSISSPTVATSSVLLATAVAAHRRYCVTTVDIKSAYLNAELPANRSVFLRIDKRLSTLLLEVDPATYQPFLQSDGTLIVKLIKALYGCIESARLWYEHLKATLLSLCYTVSSYDECLFIRDDSIITLHVDDLLILCATIGLRDSILRELQIRYRTLNIVTGLVHDYLGMRFTFSPDGRVNISMTGYINNIKRDYDYLSGSASTPASLELFSANSNSAKLNEEHAYNYHSCVARLLFLSKRTYPSLLTSVAYLSTRIQCSTDQDANKLKRVLKYITTSPPGVLDFHPSDNVNITAFVDASYGCHPDARSHSGGVIYIGKCPIFFKSTKQKLNCKSSTEAELIALSDLLSPILWIRNIMLELYPNLGPAIIYEDNLSVIDLLTKGRSTAEKTRHIHMRFFFICDYIARGEIIIKPIPTEYQVADLLTKPLSRIPFHRLRTSLHSGFTLPS